MNTTEYYIGHRDAIAGLFACIRDKESVREVLHTIATDMAKGEHPNPHAVWYLEHTKALEPLEAKK